MILTPKIALEFTMAENTRIRQSNEAKIARRLVCEEENQFALGATLGFLLMWNPSSDKEMKLPLELCLLIVSFIRPSRIDAVKFSKICKQAFVFGTNAKHEYMEKHGKSYEELQPYVINPMPAFFP